MLNNTLDTGPVSSGTRTELVGTEPTLKLTPSRACAPQTSLYLAEHHSRKEFHVRTDIMTDDWALNTLFMIEMSGGRPRGGTDQGYDRLDA